MDNLFRYMLQFQAAWYYTMHPKGDASQPNILSQFQKNLKNPEGQEHNCFMACKQKHVNTMLHGK